MRLEDVAVRLRTRSPYEAIDLGYAMTRTWWRHVFPIWASVFVPVALLLNAVFYAFPLLALLAMWLIIPLMDRVILHVLAGAAFGAPPTRRDTWRALPQLLRRGGFVGAITWGRLDPARAFNAPVVQLEGQTGKAARQRRAVLAREGGSAAFWHTFISAHFVGVLLFGVYAFVELFVPGQSMSFEELLWGETAETATAQFTYNAVYALSILALEPFYVAGGFALYLNARTVLEGWDIELALKRMASRLASHEQRGRRADTWLETGRIDSDDICTASTSATDPRPPSSSGASEVVSMAAVVTIALALLTLSVSDAAYAQSCPINQGGDDSGRSALLVDDDDVPVLQSEARAEPSVRVTPSTGAQDLAQRILSAPEFGEEKTTWRIRYVGPGSEEKKKPRDQTDTAWIERLGEWIAFIVRALAWGAGAAAVVGILYVIVRQWQRMPERAGAMPEMLFGLDVRPDSLPPDVAAAARHFLAAGDVRAALSLLYRGALVSLLRDGRFEVSPGDTEGVCVRQVARHYGGVAAPKPTTFAQLVAVWQRVAYARAAVARADVEQLIELWTPHFAATSSPPAGGSAGAP